jgi:hypothetical protein
MSATDRFERRLPVILDSLAPTRAPEYFDDILGQVDRTRQRPGWTFPERWLPVADIARTRALAPAPPLRLIAVALVLIALVLAALFVAGSQRKVAPPFGPARNGEIVYAALKSTVRRVTRQTAPVSRSSGMPVRRPSTSLRSGRMDRAW